MENYAWRVQKSVFESDASEASISQLKHNLWEIIDGEEDFVLFFKICERDWQKQEKYGIGANIKNQMPDDGFVIL